MAFSFKPDMLSQYSVHESIIDMSQSADDLACCKVLARKHHRDFLLMIMGLVKKLNETARRASLTRRDLPIIRK